MDMASARSLYLAPISALADHKPGGGVREIEQVQRNGSQYEHGPPRPEQAPAKSSIQDKEECKNGRCCGDSGCGQAHRDSGDHQEAECQGTGCTQPV